MKIINISVRIHDGSYVPPVADGLSEEGYDITAEDYDYRDIDTDGRTLSALLDSLERSDFLIIWVSGNLEYFRSSGTVIKKAQQCSVPIFVFNYSRDRGIETRDLFPYGDDDYDLLYRYAFLGGKANLRGMLLLVIGLLERRKMVLPDPVIQPPQGVYVPGCDDTSFGCHLNNVGGDKPVIGILLSSRRWNGGDLQNIDVLMDAVRENGGEPLAVFLNYAEKGDTGSIGIRRIIDEYLVKDGHPIVDSVINTMSSSIYSEAKLNSPYPDDHFLERLDVPILQTQVLVSSEQEWKDSIYGLTTAEVAYDVAFPEFDGQIITIPFSSTERSGSNIRHVPIPERTSAVAEMAVRWGRLRHLRNSEKKVAILLYMYPPESSNGGSAAGLDTFQSVSDILNRMKDEGYHLDWVPSGRDNLVSRIYEGITNDVEWVDANEMFRRASGIIDKEEYIRWFGTLSEKEADWIVRDWGEPPGNILVSNGRMAVPGIINGNVLISFQPARGKDQQVVYHNHNCSIPHQYLAFYRWMKEDFKADAVIHVGTHGTLEWLPGKSVALSGDCAPDYVLSQLPNLYIYVICNPGEGIQAKRRSYAVLVDHLIPALMRSGTYESLEKLEVAVQAYLRMKADKQEDQISLARRSLLRLIDEMNMRAEAGLTELSTDKDVDSAVDGLYDYLESVKDNIIKDGLHIFGRIPEGERMHEMIYCLTRLPNGNKPSLPGSVAIAMGYNLEFLQENPLDIDEITGKFNAQVVDRITDVTMELIREMTSAGWDPQVCRDIVSKRFPQTSDKLTSVIAFISRDLYPNILGTSGEMDSLMHGLDGGFVPPGPSGCPTRGRADLLPTGKNFYGMDPDSIPTHASWELGKRMADQMIEKFLDERGHYPDSVGVVIWATDTLKTGGDDVAYILWLMGIRPVWAGIGDRVTGLEIVPLEELNRPRIDVTIRISGLFRDAFPNLTEMFDEAVQMIAGLDESEEMNHLRANQRREMADLIASGISKESALDESLTRIFSAAPGQYGAGVNVMIWSSQWEDRKEIGNYYIDAGGYSYRPKSPGKLDSDTFRRRMTRIEATVKNSTSREYDMLDNDDVFMYLGGFNAAVESVTGQLPMSFIGCSADTSKPVTRTIEEECRFIFRSKVLNPKYAEGLKVHGFRGATEIKHMFEYVLAWDATSDIIEDWMYDSLAKEYLLKDDVREWMSDANPYAVHDMLEILMEAMERGMWNPTEEMYRLLEQIYLENEEMLEALSDR